VPCAVTNLGLILAAQWLVIGAGTSCRIEPDLNATARLHLTIRA
jgi:hypothetical protein